MLLFVVNLSLIVSIFGIEALDMLSIMLEINESISVSLISLSNYFLINPGVLNILNLFSSIGFSQNNLSWSIVYSCSFHI